jgi:hypothetical protein
VKSGDWKEKKKEEKKKKRKKACWERSVVGWGVAVAGCSWCQSTEDVRAVRMVPVRVWQWQYWRSCGGVKSAGWKRGRGQEGVLGEVRGGMGSGSGWVQLVPLDRGDQCGSNGTSGNVAVAVLAVLWWGEEWGLEKKKEKKRKKACWERSVVGWGVAVAGCSWCQSIEEIRAVRMVPVRVWQWLYWRSCDKLNKKMVKMENEKKKSSV